jgi:HSP20 family molecular chaperone IbpA
MAAETAKPKRDIARKEAGGLPENLKETERAYLPDACVYEDEDGLSIVLDVPGVEKGKVTIEVDESDTLQVLARNAFAEPGGALFREWSPGDFHRSFRLGQGFDKDAIAAKLDLGVLELRIPRKEEAKPKRVEIQA